MSLPGAHPNATVLRTNVRDHLLVGGVVLVDVEVTFPRRISPLPTTWLRDPLIAQYFTA